MKLHKIIISMILIIGLMAGNLYISPVEAKTVEVKTKKSYAELKIKVLNEDKQYRMNEMAFSIKNKTNKKIKVTRVYLQYNNQGKWQTLRRTSKSVEKRNTIIEPKSKVYDNFNTMEAYEGPIYGRFPGGTYCVCVKYKYKGKKYFTRKKYHLNGPDPNEMETIPGYEGDGQTKEEITMQHDGMGVPESSTNKTTAVTKAKAKIVNTDFFIREKGKATAMVFVEAKYNAAKKIKVYASIQRKVEGKWKKYKSYKITRKSNIAFLNEQVKLKKKGKYRMWVKVTVYGKKKRKTYKVKSKNQTY